MRLTQFFIFYDGITTTGYIIKIQLKMISKTKILLASYGTSSAFTKKIKNSAYGYKLTQGDTIKLGRVRFKIKELHRGEYQRSEETEIVCKTNKSLLEVKNSKKK